MMKFRHRAQTPCTTTKATCGSLQTKWRIRRHILLRLPRRPKECLPYLLRLSHFLFDMFEANGYQIRSSTFLPLYLCFLDLSYHHLFTCFSFSISSFPLALSFHFTVCVFLFFLLLGYMGTGQRNIPGVVGKRGTGPHTQHILGGWHSGLQMSDITRVCWAARVSRLEHARAIHPRFLFEATPLDACSLSRQAFLG